MFYKKDHRTGLLFDPRDSLSPKRRALLNNSWATLFREKILAGLPVEELKDSFDPDFGRPTKELHMIMGALILQQMLDLTDHETIKNIAFNMEWHYALNINGESDKEAYLCPKTLWSMQKLFSDLEMEDDIFDNVNDVLSRAFDVDTTKQRIDSIHIKSNMRHIGRIRIIAETIKKFLKNLKRHHRGLFDKLAPELVERYTNEREFSSFTLFKPSESERTLVSVCVDLYNLSQRFNSYQKVKKMDSYGLLLRVLDDQCVITGDDVSPKPAKDVSANSVQNPSDPDATYDAHKGKGYQVQVMETYLEKRDNKTLNLITYVEVEQAHESDAHALIPALEATKQRGLFPDEVLADSLYGSDKNCEEAKEMGVEVVSPVMGNDEESGVVLSDFEVSDKGRVVCCPRGHPPAYYKVKKTRHSVGFAPDTCSSCPLASECPAKPGKKYYYLRFDDKAMRLSRRRAYEKTQEFKDRYRMRTGIEATMSEYDRLTGVKELRVRGKGPVRFVAKLKIVGVNLLRATKVQNARKQDIPAPYGLSYVLFETISIFKEQFRFIRGKLQKTFTPPASNYEFSPKMAV